MSNAVTKLDFEASVKYLNQIQEILDVEQGLGHEVAYMVTAAKEANEKSVGQVWLKQIQDMSTRIHESITATYEAIGETIKALEQYHASLEDFSSAELKFDDM